MAQLTMYPAKINSPATTLQNALAADATTMTLVDATVLPAAPGLATIGTGDTAETVKYTIIAGNDVTIERAFQGSALAWDAGTPVARYYTAYDHDTFKANIEDLVTDKVSKTLMDAAGDLIVGSAADTVARLAVGTAGQSLISDGTTPVWSDAGAYASMSRQAIINANFEVAQVGAGAEITAPANLSYPVFDLCQARWVVDGGTPPTIKHSQVALTPGLIPGSKYGMKINVDGAGSGYGANSYNVVRLIAIEHGTSMLCGDGKKITFVIKGFSTIANKKIGVAFVQNYGTGGSPSAEEAIIGANITLTSTPTDLEVTVTTNTLSGKTFGTANNDFLAIDLYYQWGATIAAKVGAAGAESFVGSGDIVVAQMQLNGGDVALPFEPKSYQQELEACRRFLKPLQTGRLRMAAYQANFLIFDISQFYQAMRTAAPSLLQNKAESTGWNVASTTLGIATGFTLSVSINGLYATKTSHGLTDGMFYVADNYSLFLDSRF